MGKWRASGETEGTVELSSGGEGGHRTSLETDSAIVAALGLGDDVAKKLASDTASAVGGDRAHGLDLAVSGAEFAEGAATGEHVVFPTGPKCNAGGTKGIEVEGVNTLRGRVFRHVVKMFLE